MSLLINKWLELGNRNRWIQFAVDPPFTDRSFTECQDVKALWDRLDHGNWCLGEAFYLGNICFINQIPGGFEWLVLRDDIPFENITFNSERTNLKWLDRFITNVKNATEQQLRECKYTPEAIGYK